MIEARFGDCGGAWFYCAESERNSLQTGRVIFHEWLEAQDEAQALLGIPFEVQRG